MTRSANTRTRNSTNRTSNNSTRTASTITNRRNIVKSISFALIAAGSICIAHAQGLTATLTSVYEALNANSRYEVSLSDDYVSIVDPSNGAELSKVKEVSAVQVTVYGTVSTIVTDDAAARDAIRSHISEYNTGALVGTLNYNESTYEVTMTHHINPSLVNASTIARTAELVADAVRTESIAIAAIQQGTHTACAASKEICSR